MFHSTTGDFIGSKVCALDKMAMASGLPATQQCHDDASIGSPLAAHIDSAIPPPAGSPGIIISQSELYWNSMNFYKFTVDWATPANSVYSSAIRVPLSTRLYPSCENAAIYSVCAPQKGTTQLLDTLSGRLLKHLTYRNFGTHGGLVANTAIPRDFARNGVGAQPFWAEFRVSSTTGAITKFQEGAYSPDAAFRFMASVAFDSKGNIGIGFTHTSATDFPGIRVAGRNVEDAVGTMRSELTMFTGTGSQIDGLYRWGDYSSLSLDPADNCTFWYTTEVRARMLCILPMCWSMCLTGMCYPRCFSLYCCVMVCVCEYFVCGARGSYCATCYLNVCACIRISQLRHTRSSPSAVY